MFSTQEAHKLHVYVRSSKGEPKRFGRVRATVFHPFEKRALGYVIKRPDALLMVKRQDRFVALDRIERIDQGLCVIDTRESWDKEACKRLGVNYDECVIWEHMPVRSSDGEGIGTIGDVFFDEKTGKVDHVDISPTQADKVILGSVHVPASQIKGYEDGAIVIDAREAEIKEAGGIAAKAGEAWANARHVASRESKKVSKKAGEAIDVGAYKAGEAVSAMKKRTTGMFRGFKEEFDKASRGE